MNKQDYDEFIKYLTTITEDDMGARGTIYKLTPAEAEELFDMIGSAYTGFDKNAWVFFQLFDYYEDFLEYWADHTSGEELLKKYLKFTDNETAKKSVCDFLVCNLPSSMDGYYLSSGRIVIFMTR